MDVNMINRLKEQISIFDDLENEQLAFGDGPISIESFCSCRFPIVVILQEPYTDEDTFQKYLRGELPRPNTAEDKKTYDSMNHWLSIEGRCYGYNTYLTLVSIINQVMKGSGYYEKCYDAKAYSNFIQNTAILNVKKIPSIGVQSSQGYKQWLKNEQNIKYMSSQVLTYKPKLVLLANITNFLLKSQSENEDVLLFGKKIKYPNSFISVKGNRIFYDEDTLFIDTTHFSRVSNQKKTEIIELAITWKDNNKSNIYKFKKE